MQEIKTRIYQEIEDLSENREIIISDETLLLGDGSILDSMKVVTLCIALEDLAQDYSFDFDWTSDASMSRSRSMFRTVGSLVDEFFRQMQVK
jgi:acyl carrier protein